MTPAAASTVFVVDDDADVRAAIQGLLKSMGLHCQCFGTAQEFLRNKRPEEPSCLVLGSETPRNQWPGFSARTGWRGHFDSCHHHHRSWGHTHDGESHEIRRRRVPDQAIPGSGLAGLDPPSFGSRSANARAPS